MSNELSYSEMPNNDSSHNETQSESRESNTSASNDSFVDAVFGGEKGLKHFVIRTTSGVVYAASVLACLYLGIIPTAIVTSVIALMCAIEFFQLMRLYGRMPNAIIGYIGCATLPLFVLLPRQWLFLLLFILFMSISFWFVSTPRATIVDVAVTCLGVLYIGLMLSAVVWLRFRDNGFILAAGTIASVWLNDAFAYMVGSRLGKHKMFPKISPKKSWEGAFGGLFATVAVWLAMCFFIPAALPWYKALCCAVFVCIAGVMGDLVESRIKRGAGVKDSGKLMPGHGGMLDRSDSMIFAVTTAYVCLFILGVF